jgi:prepilin-type processing-associated H-X9-DG protein
VDANICVPPSSIPKAPCGPAPGGTASIAARSWHPGGVHVLMGDASVQFVSDNVDLNTYRALGTMSKGEVATLR